MGRWRTYPWEDLQERMRLVATVRGCTMTSLFHRAGYTPESPLARSHPCAPPNYVERMARAMGVSMAEMYLDIPQFCAVISRRWSGMGDHEEWESDWDSLTRGCPV